MDEVAQPRKGPEVRDATDFPPTAFVFDGKGGVEPVPIDTPPPAKGFQLISGSLASPSFRAWLGNNLDPYGAEGLTSVDQHARCTVVDDRALVVLRIVRSRTDPDDLSKQTMSLWIEKNRVVIAARLPIPEFVGIPTWQKSHHAPITPADLIARLGTRAADRIEPLVEHLGDKLDGIEEAMMYSRAHEVPAELTRLRRSLINLRRLLWPQRDVLNTLEIEDLSFLSPRDRARLRDAAARSARLGDELQVLAERAALIHEQVLDIRAEQMNQTMLLLAAVTVILMPLTVISGILGMNVPIPYADDPAAFWIVCAILVVMAIGLYVFMRKKKWM
jgi:zinc transporter